VVKINIAARLRASRQYQGLDLTGSEDRSRDPRFFVFLQIRFASIKQHSRVTCAL
jgi:hypothetical protein